jgi:3,4-dihydroxy 2-butanone 4-phosphate synthase/GTP cyclohydrolase II
VADDRDREDEVDVVLSAATASSRWLAWTIRHSSGYVCAPMQAARADALELPLMVAASQDPRRTAYTVTVDAARGVTTGISAADRALTLRTLADPATTPADLIRPGHVVPLRAVPGGVLERGGHTEAAVDLCRLAGAGEVAAIAELVDDDGTMLRLPAATELAAREGLVLVTIAELAAWRRAHDPFDPPVPARVRRTGSASLPTEHGTFTVHGYQDLTTGAEHTALVADRPAAAGRAPLVRMHSECLTGDALGSLRCDCGPQLRAALEATGREGGAVVYLRGHEGRGIGLLQKIRAYSLQDSGRDTLEANLDLGLPADAREYAAGAAILADLGLRSVRLLTNNPDKAAGLRAGGIDVGEIVGLETAVTEHNRNYLSTKRSAMGHHLPGLDAVGAPVRPEHEEAAR